MYYTQPEQQLYIPQELGLVASGKRFIKNGNEYNRFFGKDNEAGTIVLKPHSATVQDTLKAIEQIINKHYMQANAIAHEIATPGDVSFGNLKQIFDFNYMHYQYKMDAKGYEQLRRPIRAWNDRQSGIDCDCFTITVASMLKSLGIPYVIRLVKMNNKSYFQHIYVIVPKFKGADLNQKSNYFTIDPVLNTFNAEAPFTQHWDNTMQLQELAGIDGEATELLGAEFLAFGNDGNDTLEAYLSGMKRHVKNSLKATMNNPKMVSHVYNPAKFAAGANHLLTNWDNHEMRAQALEHLSGIEHTFLNDELQGLEGIIHGSDEDVVDYLLGDEEMLEGLAGVDLLGLGKVKVLAKLKEAVKKPKIAAKAAAENSMKKGFFTKVKNAEKAVVKTIKKDVKNVKSKVNVATVKKVAHAVQRVNPLMAAARLLFLEFLKLNTGGSSELLRWGYADQAQAAKHGIDNKQHAAIGKTLVQLQKMFTTAMGGSLPGLRDAILSHNRGNFNGLGEPVTAAAGAATASPFIAKLVAMISKLKTTMKPLTDKAKNADPESKKILFNKIKEKFKKKPSAEQAKPEVKEVTDTTNVIPSDVKQKIADGYSADVQVITPQGPADPSGGSNADPNADAPKEGMSTTTKVIIGVGVATVLGAAIYSVVKSKPEKKASGINGVKTKKKATKKAVKKTTAIHI